MLESLEKSKSLDYLKQKSKGAPKGKEVPKNSDEFEDFYSAQKKIENDLVEYNRTLSSFFKNSQELFGKEKEKKYKELILQRNKVVEKLYGKINNSSSLSDFEKKQLKFDIDLFIIFHNFYERVLFDIDRFDQNAFRISEDQKNLINKQNLPNIASAEAQQYMAMALITNGKFSIEQMRARSREVQSLYPIPNEQSIKKEFYQEQNPEEIIKKGIYGLTAAYFYYQKKGYRVLFPSPAIDAKQKVDLLLIQIDKMDSRQKTEFSNINFENIHDLNNIPKGLRPFFTLVQIKCHGPESGRGSSEIVYKTEYLQEAVEDMNQRHYEKHFEEYKKSQIAKGLSAEHFDQANPDRWEFLEIKEKEGPKKISLRGIEFPSDFNSRYVDFNILDAQKVIDSRGGVSFENLEIGRSELRYVCAKNSLLPQERAVSAREDSV